MNEQGVTALSRSLPAAQGHPAAWEALRKEIFVRDGVRRRPDRNAPPQPEPGHEGKNQHERLMLWIVVWSWGLLMAIILGLHFYNYGLETKTSSKSPTHAGFYEVVGGTVSGSTRKD